MENWHFFPWATQYLIGGSVILFAAVYLLHKNKKSWIYRVFFFLGLFIALWQFSAFLHRIAPTALLSKQFFRLDVFFVLPITSFLLLMFLFFIGEKGVYTIVLVPPFVIGLLGLLMSPFEIIWVGPDLGWTYRFKPYFALIAYGVPTVYTVPVLLVAYILIKKSGRALRKKLTLILYGFLGCYWGITLLNVVMQKVTSLPPFGGVSGTFLFLIIAYVMDLPMEKLSSSFGSRKLAERLSSAYVDFLNALEDKIPGK